MSMLLMLLLLSSGGSPPGTLQDALAFERAGDDHRALTVLDGLVRAAPDGLFPRLEAARIRLKLARDLDRAELDLEVARSLAPENPRAQYLWGLLREERGDDAAALLAYQSAVALRASYEDARFRLAGLHFARAEWAAAAEHYRVLAQSRPDWTQVRLQLVAALEQGGQAEEAEAELVRLWSEQPRSKLVGRRLADLYDRTNRPEEAGKVRERLDDGAGQKKMRPLRKSRQ